MTDSGHLIVYNINQSEIPWEKIAAHDKGASTLDWHPTRPYVIATGGSADKSVKSTMPFIFVCCHSRHLFSHSLPFFQVWDLETKSEANRTQNSNTATSLQSDRSAVTDDANEQNGRYHLRIIDIIHLRD